LGANNTIYLKSRGGVGARVGLASIIDPRRMAAEPRAAARIVELCAGHPLALRIGGAKLAARPHWSLTRLADRLADQRTLLDELRLGDREVRSGLLENHLAQRGEVRRALLSLSMLGTASFSLATAASTIGRPVEETQVLVDELIDAHLLGVVGEPPEQYRLHRLTWSFACDLASAQHAGGAGVVVPAQRVGPAGAAGGCSDNDGGIQVRT
ncbi:hypothetical protein ACFW2E_12700, partial [Streptomyces sp. NPDC058964]